MIIRWKNTKCTSRGYLLILLFCLLLSPGTSAATDLLQAWKLANKNDPVFLAALANYEADRALKGQVRADLLPQIDASAGTAWNDNKFSTTSPSYNTNPRQYNSSGYSINLRQSLVDAKRFALLRQANAEARKAEAEIAVARQSLIRRVAIRYFAVLYAADNLTLAKAERTAVARQLEVAKGRLQAGLGTITEVHDAGARAKLAEAQELEAGNTLSDQQEALQEVVGQRLPNLRTLKKNMPLILPDPPDISTWVKYAEQQNFDLIAKKESVTIARKELSVQRYGHMPTLDVVGSHSRSNSISRSDSADLTSTNNAIGLELTIPIFSGGRIAAESKEARYRYQAAQHEMESKRRNVVRTARNAFLGVASEVSRVKALAQAVIASQSALDAKQGGFEAGITTNVEVLDAQRDLYRTKRDYTQARFKYILNTLRLKDAAGSLSKKDLEQINGWLE